LRRSTSELNLTAKIGPYIPKFTGKSLKKSCDLCHAQDVIS